MCLSIAVTVFYLRVWKSLNMLQSSVIPWSGDYFQGQFFIRLEVMENPKNKYFQNSRPTFIPYTRSNSQEGKLSVITPAEGFGSQAKTRGGTLGVPGCRHTRTKNICCRRRVLAQRPKTRGSTLGVPGWRHTRTKNMCWKSKKCVCSRWSVLDLTKLGAHGRLG